MIPTAKSVLIIDDNEQDAEMTRLALGKAGVGSIAIAEDGLAGLDYLMQHAARAAPGSRGPALVLLDIKMPRLTGIELLQKLRAEPTLRHLPVVMWTSSSLASDLTEAYEAGANGYVVKPIDFKEFRETLAAIADYWLRANRSAGDPRS